MAYLYTSPLNTSWLKLAEFIAYNEKERALAMYALLAPSLPHTAFAAHLEGNLLLAFQDERALLSYLRAAALYEQRAELLEACALYEHCITLLSDFLPATAEHMRSTQFCFKRLIELYNHQENITHQTRCLTLLLKHFIHHKLYQDLSSFLEELSSTIPLLEHALTIILEDGEVHVDFIGTFLKKILDHYMSTHQAHALTRFMVKLLSLNSKAHTYCYGILTSI